MCSQIEVGSEWQGPECSVVGQGETGLEEKVDVGVGGRDNATIVVTVTFIRGKGSENEEE